MSRPDFVCGYEILAELGRGSTGIVYQARHPVVRPDRLVAIKMPSLGSAAEAVMQLAQYQNEWNALRLLTWEPDPAIPTLWNVGCDAAGQQRHYVREFVEGRTLQELAENGAINFRQGIRMLATIARAVQRMHDRGIAHGNLRASRILVRTDGSPKLIGFGHVGPLAGVAKLPPELSGVPAEVDVLALGELLALLTATLHQSVPVQFDVDRQPGRVPSPGHFALALDSCL